MDDDSSLAGPRRACRRGRPHDVRGKGNEPGRSALLPQFDCICRAAIDMFFVISGLVLVTAARGASDLRGAAVFLYQRTARVYPLYWICTAVVAGIALWRPEWRVGRLWSDYPGDHLRALLLLPQPGGPVLGVAWTLVHEMYFYVVLAAIGLAGERRTVRLLLAWAALVFLGRCCLDRGSALRNPFTDLATHPITADFILGCLAGVRSTATCDPTPAGRGWPVRG